MQQEESGQTRQVSLSTIFLVFLKVGAFTFGGGYAMLPVIQREVVERQKWVGRDLFFDSLIITQSVPGPLALNSSVIIGQHLRGLSGGLMAALGVITPSVVIILALTAFVLPYIQENIYVQAVFFGLRPAVVALIAAAAFSLARDILRDWTGVFLAAVLLATALIFNLHPITILLTGGFTGLLLFRRREEI